MNNFISWFYRTGLPLLTAVGIFRMAVTSALGVNLVVVDGRYGTYLAFLYAAVLLSVAIRPYIWVFAASAALTVAVFLGRAWAFAELWMGGRSDLEGAVWERIILGAILLLWHFRRVDSLAIEVEERRNA